METPWGYDKYVHIEVVPKPPPAGAGPRWRWRIGPVTDKQHQPEPGPPGSPATGNEDVAMQLTADQQVDLSLSGEDAYGNPVEITGDTVWKSSDESVVTLVVADPSHATAVAVGPIGTAAVTVTNDVDGDGTGDYLGNLAVDVVAGKMADIAIAAAEPVTKPPVA